MAPWNHRALDLSGGNLQNHMSSDHWQRKDTSAPDAELLVRCSGCSGTLPLGQFAGMIIPCPGTGLPSLGWELPVGLERL